MRLFLLVLVLISCNQASQPADAVKKALDGLKRLDPVVLSQLAGGKDVLKDTPEQAKTILKNALGKLEYEILNTETKDNQARVTVNLKVVEVGKMADAAMKQAMTKLGENASKEQRMDSAMEIFNQALNDSSMQRRASQIKVYLEKNANTWELVGKENDELGEALFKGVF